MNTRLHGVTSLGIAGIATVIATVTLFQQSGMLGLGYLAALVVAGGGVIYADCAKCPCRTHCGHILPGKLAVMLTNRKTEPYTPIEFAVIGGLVVILIGLPLLWLWRSPLLLGVFVILNAVAGIQIRTVLCRACDNTYCPGNSRYSTKN